MVIALPMRFWVGMIAKFVICWFQARGNLALENLALRQQLAVLNRNAKRPQFRDSDRLFWVLFSGFSFLGSLFWVLFSGFSFLGSLFEDHGWVAEDLGHCPTTHNHRLAEKTVPTILDASMP
jgi:hypothetical protein